MSPTAVTLKQVREAKQLSQVELAELSRVRQATISEMETGTPRRINRDVLDRLCAVLKVKPGDLLERDPSSPRARGQ